MWECCGLWLLGEGSLQAEGSGDEVNTEPRYNFVH